MATFKLEVPVVRRKILRRPLTLYLRALPPGRLKAPEGPGNSAAYEDWLRAAVLTLRGQAKSRLSGRVDISIRLEDRHARRGASSCIKPVEDLLVRAGMLPDDRAPFIRAVKCEWAEVHGMVIEIVRCP
jgi:hypothetical protein